MTCAAMAAWQIAVYVAYAVFVQGAFCFLEGVPDGFMALNCGVMVMVMVFVAILGESRSELVTALCCDELKVDEVTKSTMSLGACCDARAGAAMLLLAQW